MYNNVYDNVNLRKIQLICDDVEIAHAVACISGDNYVTFGKYCDRSKLCE